MGGVQIKAEHVRAGSDQFVLDLTIGGSIKL